MIPDYYEELIRKLWDATQHDRISWEESSAIADRFLVRLDGGAGGERPLVVEIGTGSKAGTLELLLRQPNGDLVGRVSPDSFLAAMSCEQLAEMHDYIMHRQERSATHVNAAIAALDTLAGANDERNNTQQDNSD